MGERATRLEAATADDIARMRALATEAVRAGAIGFSTSRSINHRSASGNPMPSLKAAEEELTAIALGLKDAGRGVLQMILDFDDPDLLDAEFAMLKRIVQASGRPLSFSMMQKHGNKAGFERLLDLTAAAAAEGLPIRAQVAPRIVGVLLGLQGSRNVFSECPGYAEIADLPLAQRVARMRDPQLQDRLVREVYLSRTPLGRRLTDFENMFPLGDPPDYDPGPERSIAAEARRRGLDPAQVALDYLLRDEGRFTLVSPFANYADRNLDACARMLAHGQTVIGLGDGGAHVSLVSDASFPTTLLTQWLGHDGGNPAFGLPALVKKQTHDTAVAVGLNDRGVLRAGMKADINVIDMEALRLEPPVIEHDLPAGSARYVQRARGYRATVVSGQVVYRDGEPAGPLPGRLVRG
jgi:N-acyl-D-aspartate/D-glutamate deacylase